MKKEADPDRQGTTRGMGLNRICHLRAAFPIVQRGSPHARPRVSHAALAAAGENRTKAASRPRRVGRQ